MGELAISVEGLGKHYTVDVREPYSTLRETMMRKLAAPARWLRRGAGGPAARRRGKGGFWALRGVGFDVRRGEVMGVVGRNGAGKSTLLKILSRIVEPTEGHADLWGRVGSLLEVGTGFHNELSGRDNIYMSGSMLGMRKAEIDRKFEEIVSFAEVEKFIDTPVKRYSSGMYMRLGFAVAAHLEPEILLVDEVLAVGDSAFQKKCLGKMDDVAAHGRTVLFVSHNMAAVQALCGRTVWIDAGAVAGLGPTREVVGRYLEATAGQQEGVDARDRLDRQGDGSMRITSVRIESADGGPVIRTNSRVRVSVDYEADQVPERVRVWVEVLDMASRKGICLFDSELGDDLPESLPRRGTLVCESAPTRITPGRCTVGVGLIRNGLTADEVLQLTSFDVEVDEDSSGRVASREWVLTDVPHRWAVQASPGGGQ